MVRPLTAPWCLRFDDSTLEFRLLVERTDSRRAANHAPEPAADSDDICLLHWTESGHDEVRLPARVRATTLGNAIAIASFRIAGYAGRGGRYAIECGAARSREVAIAADPQPGSTWRFLIASDHQNHPNAQLSIWAARRYAMRRPFHAVLFPGDMTRFPDAPESWFGDPAGNSFFDSMSAPARSFFDKARRSPPGWPLLSATPILACPGNHEVSAPFGATPFERFTSVTPDSWNIDVYAALFLPGEDEAVSRRPGWYAARIGPIEFSSLFVTRYWVPGDHKARTGPCYEPPGRFIFETFAPGARQHEWLRERTAAQGRGTFRVALMHDGPFAQGHNALPLFGVPVEYRRHLIAEHLVPLFERRVNLVLSGHNHAVNHHEVNGVHYFESSHFAYPLEPARRLPDGRVAPEPLGHPSTCFYSEPGRTFFSVLEVTAGDVRRTATITAYRVLPARVFEEACVCEVS